jgi:hypothetical protein
MAGPIYHPVTPCGSHDACCFGFSWAAIRVPGGANGAVLKSNGPNTCAYADNFLFSRELHRRLSIMVACWSSWHHRCMGKWASTVLRPAMKWDLNVRIALSAALRLWICGGTSWYRMFSLRRNSFIDVYASFSII